MIEISSQMREFVNFAQDAAANNAKNSISRLGKRDSIFFAFPVGAAADGDSVGKLRRPLVILITAQSRHLRLRHTHLCLRFLINDFDQNFANQPTAPRGYGNFSFRSNCASASRIVLNRPFHAKLRWW